MTPHTNHDSEEKRSRKDSSEQDRQPENEPTFAEVPPMSGRIPLGRSSAARGNRAMQRFVEQGTLMPGDPANDEPAVNDARVTLPPPTIHQPVQRFWSGLMDLFSGEEDHKPAAGGLAGGLIDFLNPKPQSGGAGGLAGGIAKGLYPGGATPPGIPIPYPNTLITPSKGGGYGIKGGSMGPGSIKSIFPSSGDEPGTLKGISSSTIKPGGGIKGGGNMGPGSIKSSFPSSRDVPGTGMSPSTIKGITLGATLPPTGLLSPEDWEAQYKV